MVETVKLQTEKPTPAADTPAPEAKAVRVTVNFPGPVTVGGVAFEGSKLYAPGSLKWKDEDWAKAKADGRLAIEEVDASGKVFVPRRNSAGQVVPSGAETVPPKPRKKAKKDED